MRIFIDSADFDQIKNAWDTGLVDGVTTNPTLIKKAGGDPIVIYRKLYNLGVPDISMEVMGNEQDMIDEAMYLHEQFGEQCTVKLPMTPDGLAACSYLSGMDIRTNVTLIFNAAQALLAAKSGATYVSPFVGRIDDQGYAGLEVVRSIALLIKQGGFKTQTISASIRTPHRAVRSFFNGAEIVTMPPQVFWQMFNHVLTDQGLEIFDKDSKS